MASRLQENHRWGESRVYSKKTPNFKSFNGRNVSQQTLAAVDNNSLSSSSSQHQHQQQQQQLSTTLSDAVSSDDTPVASVSKSSSTKRYLVINLSSSSSYEKREFRRKLYVELGKVRKFIKGIEDKEIKKVNNGYSHSQLSTTNAVVKRAFSEVKSPIVHADPMLSIPVGVAKEIKANQSHKNSTLNPGKEKLPPFDSNKKLKPNGVKNLKGGAGGEREYRAGMDNCSSNVFNNCKTLLAKLMKHKHGWVFNSPVDVKALGLQDYHLIIKHPMDLGTVKSRLDSKWYRSAREFAEDVKLTFSNAMTYNPKGQDVHVMAEQLLKIFEQGWGIIESEYNLDSRFEVNNEATHPIPLAKKASHPLPTPPTQVRNTNTSELPRVPVDPVPQASLSYTPSAGKTPNLKKPKVKDLEKRNMTYEEKQKLRQNLESLPSEKLEIVVQIIKKRNASLFQHDDEIEVDIESFDTETLWELDRFVTNYKKSLSKLKRKAELAITGGEGKHAVQERNPISVETQMETKESEKNVPSPPVRLEKQGDNGSKSSSSSSSSSDSGSSSNDFDSGSSSASDAGG
ncbi:hypothetical protein GIB67_000203 [Kingdonia uniflora]|uniref:Transcription factor GTE4-like n=1 Tax=Kingdonia uniflora TaxID=39325 RepID=A0A7J7P9M8_9MAGN|nr:hypothetical protein GIB67_000203 [Kingdonia uniflora]